MKYCVRFLFAAEYWPFLNARDTMLAMVLSSPDMFSGVRLDACLAWTLMTSMRSIWLATMDFEVRSFCAHATTDVLL